MWLHFPLNFKFDASLGVEHVENRLSEVPPSTMSTGPENPSVFGLLWLMFTRLSDYCFDGVCVGMHFGKLANNFESTEVNVKNSIVICLTYVPIYILFT